MVWVGIILEGYATYNVREVRKAFPNPNQSKVNNCFLNIDYSVRISIGNGYLTVNLINFAQSRI